MELFSCEAFPIFLAAVVTTIITWLYLHYKKSFSYFARKNIPYLPPLFPGGNTYLSFFRHYGHELGKFYIKFKNQGAKYAGFYMLTKPAIIIIDPELIKDIFSKNFKDFNSRGMYINEEREFLTAHLGALSGPTWKTMRAKINPLFTSAKLKIMFETILQETGKLESKLEQFANTSTAFDCKNLTVNLTSDMFCSLFLGIECNSLDNPDAGFTKYAKMLVNTNLKDGVRMSLAFLAPKLLDFLNLNFLRQDFTDFFVKAVTDIVEHRENNSIERPDLMNLLIRLKNNKSVDDGETSISAEDGITLKQLIAQCFVFFLAGFDTSSSTITYTLFELVQNIELQDKTRQEIHSILKKHGGSLTYDALMDMKLLDKVISETLRKYPSVVALNRMCVSDYTIPGTDTVIEKGTPIIVPLLGVHYDPEYYPDPDKFDPERFTEEEKNKRHPNTYMPFGDGPRFCIGFRFGLLQVKLAIISFLKDYKFTLNPKTKLPLEFKTETVLLSNYGQIWLDTVKN